MPRSTPRNRALRAAPLLACAALALGLAAGLAGCTTANSPAVGTWGEEAPGTPHLVLEKNGEFSGNDGCNHLFGTWRVSGDAIEFREMGTTEMFCEGVDTWLSKAAGGSVSGDLLSLTDAAGAKLGTLARG